MCCVEHYRDLLKKSKTILKNRELLRDHAVFIESTIEKIYIVLESHQLESIHGTHFNICPWAFDTTTCGPDNCFCNKVGQDIKQLEKILGIYKRG